MEISSRFLLKYIKKCWGKFNIRSVFNIFPNILNLLIMILYIKQIKYNEDFFFFNWHQVPKSYAPNLPQITLAYHTNMLIFYGWIMWKKVGENGFEWPDPLWLGGTSSKQFQRKNYRKIGDSNMRSIVVFRTHNKSLNLAIETYIAFIHRISAIPHPYQEALNKFLQAVIWTGA